MHAGSQCVVEEGSLSGFDAYAWRNDPPIQVRDDTGYVSPLAVADLQRAVQQEMRNKGFQRLQSHAAVDGANGGLTLALTLRTRRELVSMTNTGSLCQTVDCWERIDMTSEARMDIRTIGFLAADVFMDGKPIWRGWVETTLYPKDRDRTGEVIGRAVPKLFESFPP